MVPRYRMTLPLERGHEGVIMDAGLSMRRVELRVPVHMLPAESPPELMGDYYSLCGMVPNSNSDASYGDPVTVFVRASSRWGIWTHVAEGAVTVGGLGSIYADGRSVTLGPIRVVGATDSSWTEAAAGHSTLGPLGVEVLYSRGREAC